MQWPNMLSQLTAVITFLWAGMILGIALASGIKFLAPTLTKAVGLDVGRTVFRFFHHVQLFLLFIILLNSIFLNLIWCEWIIILLLISMLLLQMGWLFPRLCQDINIIVAGGKISDHYTHRLYGMFEVSKFLILILLGIKLINRLFY